MLKPGPGHYPPYPSITKSGIYFLSKFKSSLCRTFRARVPDPASTSVYTSQTPGPGTYPAPSEFGVYRAQEKFIKEFERTEDKRKAVVTARAHRKNNSRQPMSEGSVSIRFNSTSSQPMLSSSKMKHNTSEIVLSREQPNEVNNHTKG